MVKLEDIHPGDIIIPKRGIEGIVCSLEDLKLESVAHGLALTHLLGGTHVWCIWADQLKSGPLFARHEYIVEHRPQGTQYDPSQQPFTDEDV